MLSPHSPTQNHLLAALPKSELEHLAARLELVHLPLGDMLYEPNMQLKHAYFPTTSIVSLHYVTESGASAEAAGVGNEGIVGVSLFMGGQYHAQFRSCSNRRVCLPIGAQCATRRVQSGWFDAAVITALYPSIDDSNYTDSGL